MAKNSFVAEVTFKNFIKYSVIYFFMLLFEIFLFVIYFSVFYLLVSFQNLGKARYQTSNILLSLAITIEAVVFTYSNQKNLTLCNFAKFFSRFCVFFWWPQFPLQEMLLIILLVYNFNALNQYFLNLYEIVSLCLTHKNL